MGTLSSEACLQSSYLPQSQGGQLLIKECAPRDKIHFLKDVSLLEKFQRPSKRTGSHEVYFPIVNLAENMKVYPHIKDNMKVYPYIK